MYKCPFYVGIKKFIFKYISYRNIQVKTQFNKLHAEVGREHKIHFTQIYRDL